MPKRPPTMADRLRSVWSHRNAAQRPSQTSALASATQEGVDRAAEFAQRLRAAVAARG